MDLTHHLVIGHIIEAAPVFEPTTKHILGFRDSGLSLSMKSALEKYITWIVL